MNVPQAFHWLFCNLCQTEATMRKIKSTMCKTAQNTKNVTTKVQVLGKLEILDDKGGRLEH